LKVISLIGARPQIIKKQLYKNSYRRTEYKKCSDVFFKVLKASCGTNVQMNAWVMI